MEAKWRFRIMSRGEMNADPIESEFFSTDHLGSITDALVRETIQNSLDAGQPGEPILVKFAIAETGGGSLDGYFSTLRPHLDAKQNGLIDKPASGEPVKFLVIEDYGTRGLEGDIMQHNDVDNGPLRNDFFYFWRNVGRSGKSQGDRGRWGLGKTVFQAASRINSFWGVTDRQSDPELLLMGQSVLKTHMISGKKHYPYGWFGVFDGDFPLPVKGSPAETFCRDFSVDRDGKPGLSVVVPFPDPSIKAAGIVGSVLIHYFFPILSGDLSVQVVDKEKSHFIYRDLMEKYIRFVDFGKTKMTEDNFRSLFDISKWAMGLKKTDYAELSLPDSKKAPEWSEGLFASAALEQLRNRFEQGERIALHVPMRIQAKGKHHQNTYFRVFVEKDPGLEIAEDHFIREGITLAGVKSLRQKGVRVIVSIEDKALSTFLGDAENPAHTEWQERSPKFKDRYEKGPSCLRFVKNCPREIVSILSKPAKGKDLNLLRDILYIEAKPAPGQTFPKPGIQPGVGERGDEAHPPESAGSGSDLIISSIKGGFKISRRKNRNVVGRFLIAAAYAIRKGDPFSRYSHFDFEMDKAPVIVETRNAKVIYCRRNQAVIEIIDPDFAVEFTGFDTHRDLVIKAGKWTKELQ